MTAFKPSPPRYQTVHIREWTQRDFFEREADWHSQAKSRVRYRSCEWFEFTERFVPYCEDWNGCWVAEHAWEEFTMYLSLPEGEYKPLVYPDGFSFHKSESMFANPSYIG